MPGGRGLDLPDGTRLKADGRHRVRVTDEQAAAIRGSSALRRYDALIEVAPGRGWASASEYVHPCGFAPWPWQTVCPRCGDPLPDERG